MDHDRDAWSGFDRLKADICLLNEALVPEGRKGIWTDTGTEGRDGATNRTWVAAVISDLPCSPTTDAKPELHGRPCEVPLKRSRPDSGEVVDVTTQQGVVVTAVALHGLLDELSEQLPEPTDRFPMVGSVDCGACTALGNTRRASLSVVPGERKCCTVQGSARYLCCAVLRHDEPS